MPGAKYSSASGDLRAADRPRCPSCGALVGLRTRVEGNGVLVTTRCGFRAPGMSSASRCDQPVGVVIEGGRRTYVFPPDWETMNELPLDLLMARYSRVSRNQAREWRGNR